MYATSPPAWSRVPKWLVVLTLLLTSPQWCVSGENKTLDTLFDAVDSPDPVASDRAREALRRAIRKNHLEVVLSKAQNDKRVRVRLAALALLPTFAGVPATEPPDVRGVLIEALKDKDPRIRLMGASSGGFFLADSPPLVEALVKSLEDPDRGDKSRLSVAEVAAFSLSRGAQLHEIAYRALMQAARKGATDVRLAALNSIGQLAARDVANRKMLLEFLIKEMRQAKPVRFRGAAAAVVAYIGPEAKAAIPAMCEAFRCKGVKDATTRHTIQEGVVSGLRGLGPAAKASLSTIVPALEDPQTPSMLCSSISQLIVGLNQDGKEAWPAFRRLASDQEPNEEKRIIARWTFQKLATKGPKR